MRALFINPDNPGLKAELDALKPVRGHCIFVDIAGSTELKDKEPKQWISGIYNTFANIRTFLPWLTPLKCTGDGLMFFIAEQDIAEQDLVDRSWLVLRLIDSLFSAASDRDALFREIKIGIAHCVDAYPISFIKDSPDVYGRGIDLAARLVATAQPREVVMNESFYELIKGDYTTIGNKEQFPWFPKITGPSSETFKGFADSHNVYRLRC